MLLKLLWEIIIYRIIVGEAHILSRLGRNQYNNTFEELRPENAAWEDENEYVM